MAVRILSSICFSFLFVGMISCSEPPEQFNYAQQLETEIAAIDAHLAATGQSAIKDPSGVRMVITKLGSYLPALASDSVVVDYSGKLLSDGSEFDSGSITIKLTGRPGVEEYSISGWAIAFTKLPVGSEAKLYIPSYYGYGNSNREKIPANSALVFDVKFKEVISNNAFITRLKSDTTSIGEYLNEKQIEAIKDTTGVSYTITTLGTGPKPSFLDRVTVTYSFRLLDNDAQNLITIDRSPSENFNSFVVDYLQGVKVALLNMPEGSKARVYVPSGLGFASGGATDAYGQVIIPANANLIIDLELKDVQ